MIQHDQGRAFEGAVAAWCEKLTIKMVKGRPYHPQAQGQVERAYRSYEKIMHDFLVIGKAGVNWIKSLPDYARSLNQDPKKSSLRNFRLILTITIRLTLLAQETKKLKNGI